MAMNEKDMINSEQMRYAKILLLLSRTGLVLLVGSFCVYISGMVPKLIHFTELRHFWKLRVYDFVDKTDMPTGWDWLTVLNYGESVSMLGIVFLAGATSLCFISILPILFKKRDLPYIGIVVLQLLVIFLAASGVVGIALP